MSVQTTPVSCPLCSSKHFDQLYAITEQQAAVNKEIKEARRTGSVTIKQLSRLLDKVDQLKQQRKMIMDQII